MSARVQFIFVVAITSIFQAASVQAATITVNSIADTSTNNGICTLREAITATNTDTASSWSSSTIPCLKTTDRSPSVEVSFIWISTC